MRHISLFFHLRPRHAVFVQADDGLRRRMLASMGRAEGGKGGYAEFVAAVRREAEGLKREMGSVAAGW